MNDQFIEAMQSVAVAAHPFRVFHENYGGSTPRLDPQNPDREDRLGDSGEDWIVSMFGWPVPNRLLKPKGDGGSDWVASKPGMPNIRLNVKTSKPNVSETVWRNRFNLQIKEQDVVRADWFISVVDTGSGFEILGYATQQDLLQDGKRKESKKLLDGKSTLFMNREILFKKLRPFNQNLLRGYEVKSL